MSTALGLGLGLPFRVSAGFNPAALFTNGEQGAWYDPSDYSTLFQDSAGTTPVTAVEQSVGLMLDKRVPAGPGYYSGGFDATNDSLTVGTVSSFNFMHSPTALFTFECWVNVASTASAIVIADNTGATTAQTGFFVAIAVGGAVQLGITNSNGIFPSIINGLSTSTISANTWTHIAITYDQSLASANAKFYINGVAAGTANKTAATPSSGNASQILRIGQVAGGANWFNGYISNLRITNSIVYTGAFTPSTTPLTSVVNTQLLTCQNSTFIDNSPNNFTITANGGIVPGARNPFGNHAFQSTSTSRPILRARYNLLTYSEQFDQGVWSKTDASVSSNSGVAPDGTMTADTLTTTVASNPNVQQVPGPTYQNLTLTFSFWAQAITSTEAVGQLFVNAGSPGIVVATSGGIISGPGTADTSFFSSGAIRVTGLSTTQWTRIFITGTPTSAVGSLSAYIKNRTGPGSLIGDSIRIWGAQLIVTNSLLSNNYQRIAAATDYNTSGFLPYLAFDGSDDSMLTNSVNFTATDKMTVWAGLRKLSDAADGMVVELSAAIGLNNGSFYFAAPETGAPGRSYSFLGRGTTTASVSQNASTPLASYPAPTTNVVTTTGDIVGDLNTIRVNGVAGTSGTGDQGTGNYGNYPLYIGRRNNATIPFNGQLFSLIIRGAQSSAAQISATEAWVNQRTGAY